MSVHWPSESGLIEVRPSMPPPAHATKTFFIGNCTSSTSHSSHATKLLVPYQPGQWWRPPGWSWQQCGSPGKSRNRLGHCRSIPVFKDTGGMSRGRSRGAEMCAFIQPQSNGSSEMRQTDMPAHEQSQLLLKNLHANQGFLSRHKRGKLKLAGRIWFD